MPDVAWADLDTLREACYRCCSSALLPPGPQRIDGWHATAEVIDRADPDAFSFAPAWRRLRARLQMLPNDLTSEYVRLFDAGVDGALCPPYESHWLATARRGGPALVTSELERTYRSIGLAASPHGAITAEHVATELEVGAFLCRAERAARDDADPVGARTAQRRHIAFLDEHLGRWLPMLANRVRTVAPESFYETVTDAAVAFVRHERDLLGALRRDVQTVGGP